MRILEVHKFYHERRGAERHFLDLESALSDAGHDVAVFSMRHPKNRPSSYESYFVSEAGYHDDEARNVRIFLRGIGRLFWSFEARRNMRRLIDDFKPEIAHIHNAYHQLSLSFLSVIKKRGIPVVLSVHDYHLVSPDKDTYYDEVGRSYWKFLFVRKYGIGKRMLLVLKMYWERLYRPYERSIDLYTVPSRYVRDVLVRAGIPEGKIVVLPHFIPAARPAGDVITDEEYPRPYALYFGAISPEKGISELTRVFEKLKFPLVLAGRKSMIVPEGEWTRYVGECDTETLSRLIEGASFVVSASRLPETFGLVALEAHAHGVPFVGYETGSYAEIVRKHENGLLAQSEAEFEEVIRRVIRGETVFDPKTKIRDETLQCFGQAEYIRSFESLTEGLIKSRSTAA